jgi:signal transduction histidine kinase
MTNILIVDDTADMAWIMKRAMEDQGYTALVACDGGQALKIASTEHPDVILLDIMMPQMNGIEVLRRLKTDAQLRDIPVVLVTAKDEDEDVIAGLDAGAHDYVTKPFKREILAARVRSAVRIRESHENLRITKDRLQAEIIRRKRMEKELAQAHKLEAIGHLAAGIAHEINTPAQYVGDNTRFLRDVFTDVNTLLDDLDRLLKAAKCGEITEDMIAEVDVNVRGIEVDYIKEEAPKAIDQSLEGIERVANIVRAMKEFSHPGNGHRQPINLNRAIESTLTVSRNEWKYVADLVSDFDPGMPAVPCLASDFNQVILNLVVNAAQAIANVVGDGSQGHGTITVRTRRDGDWAEISVEDTGTGIPVNIRNKVFDPFFTTKDVGKGTGQGLSIAHNIVVQKHGGTISFESEEGKGTTFVVRLPIDERIATAVAAEPEPTGVVARDVAMSDAGI